MMELSGPSFLEDIFSRVGDAVKERFAVWMGMTDAVDLRSMEEEVAEMMRGAADEVTAAVLQQVTEEPAFEALVVAAALSSERPMRRAGRRDVKVTLLGGTTITLRQVQYVKLDRSALPGPRRKPGKRGKSGVGFFPVLAALGIEWGSTPALSAEIARQVTASESFRPALEALKSRGIDLGYKPTMRIVNAFGQRAVSLRNEWVDAVLSGEAAREPVLRGKRVVVGIDGGRIRTRVPKRRGRRRKNGHRGFEVPWREPKLFVIYVIDEHGQIEKAFRPVYDGTLDDSDGVFRLLTAYLEALGADEAEQVIFLGDGAAWIWNRIEELTADLGVPSERVVEIVDWYHAVEYLGETAKLAACWTERERSNWLNETKTLLWRGRIDDVVGAIEALSADTGVEAITARTGYFTEHRDRMTYRTFKRRRIPVGSGAAESTIRRVVNLRLKGNSKFWREENAEAMLLLRAYLKAGRFDDLVAWSSSAGKKWWDCIAWQDPLGLGGLNEPSKQPAKAA